MTSNPEIVRAPMYAPYRRLSIYLLMASIILFHLPTIASADNTLTIATFNCEFLTRPKVHIKFGLNFNLSGSERDEWNQPGFRDQKFNEAAKAVLVTTVFCFNSIKL